jgi:perosamine synthetase
MSDPFIPIANTYIGPEEAQAVFDTVKSGWISMGPKVKELEALIAQYLGVRHAIAFNNGTSSLHAALQALGVGPGDEVLVPTLSYASSANVALYCGATPVFMESEPDTFNVSAEEVARRITPRTRAIMTVDLKGMPVDFDPILAVARRHGLPVLSDSAESFGAIYRGRKVGGQAPLHSFSFFANKNITMGEGGLATTDDDRLGDLIRTIRNQGQSERYVHVVIGNNYRLTDLAAAFGIEQVKRAEWILTQKSALAAVYDGKFAGHPLIRTPFVPEYVGRHTWYMYCLTLDERVDRDAVVRYMRERGVDSRLSFPPIHLQPVYREKFGYKEGDFPRSERIFRSFIDIPCWVGMDGGMIDRVVDAVSAGVERARR